MLTYDDLTWPQVRVLAIITRVNLNRETEATEPVSALRENMNLNSVWALVRRDVVDLDAGTGEVWLCPQYVGLADYCREQVEARHG
jgi:hypothetical protein